MNNTKLILMLAMLIFSCAAAQATLQTTERGVVFLNTNGTQYNGEPDASYPVKFVYNIANFQMSYQSGGNLFGFGTTHYGLTANGGGKWLSTSWDWEGNAYDFSSVSRINQVYGKYTIKSTKEVVVTNLTGTGDAYVCVHTDGSLFRSTSSCVPVIKPYGSK